MINNQQDMYPHMDYMRWDIINDLIKKHGYKSYLEIGVFNPEFNFNKIKCRNKIGVDPNPDAKANVNLTSDEFFWFMKKSDCKVLEHQPILLTKAGGVKIPNKGMFDIVFIDGLHTGEQVYKDSINALEFLNEGGAIVLHDMNPTSELMASRERKTRLWCGDCYKAWIELRAERKDLSMCVIDSDFGVGVIYKGIQELIKIPTEYNWKEFQKHKKEWLNIISVDEFKKLYL